MAEFVLKVSCGLLRGSIEKTVLNYKKYYSFKGVPYGKPPVGPNRFKDPEPFEPWEGEKDATKHGAICPQFHEFQKKILGSEDCLFLNVYTPQIPEENNILSLPVMVYLHGGGFTFGSGNDEIYGPDYLIERNVILVTVNYRVGVFGFLSLGNSDVPGNAGLKDQNLALKWVRDNIKYFGGNANNVTLFGESAGAASVHFHTLSLRSSGLFNRVILQSGCALNPWAFCENQVQRGFTLGELFGKKTDSTDELVAFLRDQPSDVLVSHQFKVLSPDERKKLSFPFVPCKELPGTGENFLTGCPETLLKSQQFAEISYIIGMTNMEGMIMLKEDSNLLSKLDKVNNDPQRIVPLDFLDSDVLIDIAKKVQKFYFNDVPLSLDTLTQYIDVSTDLEFLIGIETTLKYLSMKPSVLVRLYLFTFEGQLGYLKAFINASVNNLPKGVCHADELGYMFHNNFMCKDFPVDKESKEMGIIDKFCTFWTNFAKFSDPNDEKYGIEWGCYEVGNPQYLEINDTLNMVNADLFSERTEFWRNLYSSVKLTHKL